MNKKILAGLLMILLVLSGCGKSEKAEAQSLLGANDQILVAARGEGDVVDYEIDGKRVIQQRKYNEKLFGLSAKVEYMFSDAGYVTQIIATFPGVEEKDLLSVVSDHLGIDPVTVQEESEEFEFMVRWEKDGVAYVSRRIPEASLYVIMEKM